MNKNVLIYFKLQVLNVLSLFAFRKEFIFMLIANVISQICNIIFIDIIYANVSNIAGWNMWETLILYSVLLFTEGCINIFAQGVWKIADFIHSGEIDCFLVRPVPLKLQIFSARIDLDGIWKIFFSIIVLIYSSYNSSINWTPGKSIIIAALLICSTIIRLNLILLASSISFWMHRPWNSTNYLMLVLGDLAKYPMNIYPVFIRGAFFFMIPYAFITYYPCAYLLDKQCNMAMIVLTPIVCFFSIFLAGFVLNKGVKKYNGCGS